jgi:hypothetical protein
MGVIISNIQLFSSAKLFDFDTNSVRKTKYLTYTQSDCIWNHPP